MAVEVAALAASGATSTLVGLVVTEAWTRTRVLVARLFHRGTGTATTGDEELRCAVEGLVSALGSDDPHSLGDATDQLRRRLRHSLRDESGTARELVALLGALHQQEPAREGNAPAAAHTTAAAAGISYDVPPALRPAGPPSEVPALRTRFINRAAELTDLNAAMASGTDAASHVEVRVLAGPPGVGKSALARH